MFSTAAILIVSLALQTTTSSYAAVIKPQTVYGAMVDCGSSGTRVFIFEWDEALQYPDLLNHIEPIRDDRGEPVSMSIKPGLSSLKDEPDKADQYMEPIVDFILEKIPEGAEITTSVYIMATAGMRLLDEDTQLSIMNDIAKWLRSGYNFANIKTKVISGAAEGVYQWITVNSETKRFSKNLNSAFRPTYAILEMGGASIQVTYQLSRATRRAISQALIDDSAALRAFNKSIFKPELSREVEELDYTLVSTTFLGFGGNSVREAFVDLLVNEKVRRHGRNFSHIRSGDIMVLKDPCLTRGSSQTIERPMELFRARNQTIGFVTRDDDDDTFKVRLIGSGNHQVCREKLEWLLRVARDEKMNCKPEEVCAMPLLGTPFVPFDTFESLGLSDFYYTTNEILNLSGRYDKDRIVKKTKLICETPYKRLLQLYPNANNHDKTRVLMECFKAIWVETFLEKGLGMKSGLDNFKTVELPEAKLGWTLGAVIDKSLAIDEAAETSIAEHLSERNIVKID